MTKEAPPRELKASRSPWQRFYAWVLGRRRARLAAKANRLPEPVVSIGNLHFGGSGKTPLTAAVAEHLRDHGAQVVILSRGYGRQKGGVRIVSRGSGPLVGPRLGGDEPVLLAGMLEGVAVVVGEDRYEAGMYALESLQPQPNIFVLDDGFSHYRLARDVDILAFPAHNPFSGGKLAPSGRLREPLAAAAHADAVVLTGDFTAVPPGAPSVGDALAKCLRPFGFTGPGFSAPLSSLGLRSVADDTPISPQATKVVAVSALADNQAFLRSIEDLGLEVVAALSYRDHHAYPDASLIEIHRCYEESDAEAVVTTGKDAVKLYRRTEAPLWEMVVRSRPEASFFDWLKTRVASMP